MVNSPTFVGRARRSEPIPNDFAAGVGTAGAFPSGRLCDQLSGWLRGLQLLRSQRGGFGGSIVPTHAKVILSVGCGRLNWSITMIP